MFTDGKCDEALEPLATLTTAAYSALQSSNAIRIDSDVSDRWQNPRSSHTGVSTSTYICILKKVYYIDVNLKRKDIVYAQLLTHYISISNAQYALEIFFLTSSMIFFTPQ